MNASRSIWAVARGLGLAVIVVPAVISCGAVGSSKSQPPRPPSEIAQRASGDTESTLNDHSAGSPAPEGGPAVVSPGGQDEGNLNAMSFGAPPGETPSDVIKSFHGNGSRNSAPFLVDASTVTVAYSYDCSAVGGSGTFAAEIISVSPGSLGYDEQLIANEAGVRDGARLTLYPQQAGGNYRLRVSSDCAWMISVTNG